MAKRVQEEEEPIWKSHFSQGCIGIGWILIFLFCGPELVDNFKSLDADLKANGVDLEFYWQGMMDWAPDEQPSDTALQGSRENISWPTGRDFDPGLLACGPSPQDGAGLVAAVDPYTRVAAVALVGTGAPATSELHTLGGLETLPKLVAAAWVEELGLLVVSREGDLRLCPGLPPDAGRNWSCGEAAGLPSSVPMVNDTAVRAAALAVMQSASGNGPRLHLALIWQSAPRVVALFVQEGDSWQTQGEVPADDGRGRFRRKINLAFTDDGHLLLITAGRIALRHLRDSDLVASTEHAVGSSKEIRYEMNWQAACPLHRSCGGGLAHLRHRKSIIDEVWHPEVLTTELPAMTGVRVNAIST